jgi:hypothetical protein
MEAYKDNYKEGIDSYESPISEEIVMNLLWNLNSNHTMWFIFFLQLGGCFHKASDEELKNTLGVWILFLGSSYWAIGTNTNFWA